MKEQESRSGGAKRPRKVASIDVESDVCRLTTGSNLRVGEVVQSLESLFSTTLRITQSNCRDFHIIIALWPGDIVVSY
jgi:hypothetical protein